MLVKTKGISHSAKRENGEKRDKNKTTHRNYDVVDRTEGGSHMIVGEPDTNNQTGEASDTDETTNSAYAVDTT